MAVTDDLGRQRAALTMIHAEPFNAEAPPEALDGDIDADCRCTTCAATSPYLITTARSRSPARLRTPSRSRSTTSEHCRQSSASSRSSAPGTVDSR